MPTMNRRFLNSSSYMVCHAQWERGIPYCEENIDDCITSPYRPLRFLKSKVQTNSFDHVSYYTQSFLSGNSFLY